MTRKRRRLLTVVAGMSCLGIAAALMLNAYGDGLVFFYSPSELESQQLTPGQRLRIGGLVEEDSVVRQPDGLTINFKVTDLTKAVPVSYRGIVPDLFREGQGVVAEGSLGADGVFVASNILAKHDEKYMPPEVADALKKSGRWNEATGAEGVTKP
jgi:cytochrome c-type biogenesis protein CcmE